MDHFQDDASNQKVTHQQVEDLKNCRGLRSSERALSNIAAAIEEWNKQG